MVIKSHVIRLFAVVVVSSILSFCGTTGRTDAWNQASAIVRGINKTAFPDLHFNILDYGAVPDEDTVTDAVNRAIKACSDAGGGIVDVPAFSFLTGPVRLMSNVNLHLEDGAVLRFSTNFEDYLPVVKSRWEGMDCYNYSPLIYAANEENIAITGRGILDGQADNSNWWPWKGRSEYGWQQDVPNQMVSWGRPRLLHMMEENVPVEDRVMGDGSYLRPPFIQLLECYTILIENVKIKNSPFWLIHPVLSEHIIIRGITAESLGPNNDGCDPESCKSMLIENCFFNTGDDCIAIKSGRNEDGRRWDVPSENIVIRNCEMHDGHGGVTVGSEISGGCRNVFVEDCTMHSTRLERAIRIKTNSFRGGIIENLYARNINIGEVDEAVLKINCAYDVKNNDSGSFPPLVQNIYLEKITSQKSDYALYFQGLESNDVIRNIQISNCHFDGVKEKYFIDFASLPVMNKVYINGKLVED